MPRVVPVRGASAVESVARNLRAELYAICDDFLPRAEADGLREWVVAQHLGGGLARGGVTECARVAARGDLMKWVALCDEVTKQQQLGVRHVLAALDALISKLQSKDSLLGSPEFLGRVRLQRREFQATCYPAGCTGYIRHVDDSQATRKRVLTCILYLNPGWSTQTSHDSAGALRVYPKPRGATRANDWRGFDVAPLHNRLVLFWSDDRVPHEVMPPRERDRYAVSVWYGDAAMMDRDISAIPDR
eukprot:1423895-Prymnesium_polylepis.1